MLGYPRTPLGSPPLDELTPPPPPNPQKFWHPFGVCNSNRPPPLLASHFSLQCHRSRSAMVTTDKTVQRFIYCCLLMSIKTYPWFCTFAMARFKGG